MTEPEVEESPDPAPAPDLAPDPAPDPAPRTGIEEVDAVLAEVDGLVGRPLEEHAPTFAAAHERLRRALDVADRPG